MTPPAASPGIPPPLTTARDLLDRLHGIPAERLRLHPAPGTAREEDVVRVYEEARRLCELVDGVLVEKTVGYLESYLAFHLGYHLKAFVEQHDLGVVTGVDGMMRISPGLVRIPDVAFVRWDRFPGHKLPPAQIANFAPDLAVEVLSPENTTQEMGQKLRDYFGAGVALVWLVDPGMRSVGVYRSPADFTRLAEDDVLQGGSVLPGFSLAVREVFKHVQR